MADKNHALITGAGSGMGRATALRLANAGWGVSLLDIREDALDATRTEAAAGGAPWVDTSVVDVTDEVAVEAAVHQIVDHRGVPKLLANVAGIALRAPIGETTTTEWNRVLDVNLRGPFLLCRALLGPMADAGGGVIVNVASIGGLFGIGERGAYCAAKAGVIGLTKSIAADYSRAGIRCVAICPGSVETEWIRDILARSPDPEEERRLMAARQLDGRMGSADEIASVIEFLASPGGRFINGASLMVDGGMTAVPFGAGVDTTTQVSGSQVSLSGENRWLGSVASP